MAPSYPTFATCGTCGKEFRTDRSRQQHLEFLDHDVPEYECQTCFSFFSNYDALVNHMNSKNHWYYKCEFEDCYQSFPLEDQVRRHEVEEHYYCDHCDRQFMNYNNIRMHLKSRIHLGLNVECVFCKQHYVNATGLAQHVESGSCRVGLSLTRDLVYRIVQAKDPAHLITNHIPGWDGFHPHEATADAWNGLAYECFLCHGEFGTLNSLRQHLQSPAHMEHAYHCPNRPACDREFSTLAALTNHLESEICGYTSFENVQETIQSIMNSDRLIKFN